MISFSELSFAKNKSLKESCLCGSLILVIAALVWGQLELSAGWSGMFDWIQLDGKYIILNILSILAAVILGKVLTNRAWVSCLIVSILGFLIAEVNYYTIQLHGMPLTVADIKNVKTAMNVISGYRFEMAPCILVIFILFLIDILISVVVKKIEVREVRKSFIAARDVCLLALCGVIIFFGYFSENSIKPRKTIGWSWKEAYHQYGYVACSVEAFYSGLNVITKPEGYSVEKVNDIEITRDYPEKEKVKPDIILILNESFYDLRQIKDISTDVPYMSNLESMENLSKGYAVVPMIGGGTNCSEYELLTSNSLQLMKGITPFNVLDMTDANSIVSFLNSLGYKTIGAHSEDGINYSRSKAYSAMGFDEIHFGAAFLEKAYVGNRWCATDESLYRQLVTWYEQSAGDDSVFMYLLTIQNHGGWDMNPSELDTVHLLTDCGEYNEQINEYLTGIQLSDAAFENLTSYFENVERPVIVAMVGDHSPNFAEELVDDRYTEAELEMRLRSTPFVIWSNYGIETRDLGYISMNYLVPTILDMSGVELSPYYQYMVNLRKEVPVLASYDKYMDTNGTTYSYEDASDEVRNYH